jgi:chromosome segregation ATPase
MNAVLASARRKLAQKPDGLGFRQSALTYEENLALRIEVRRPELERLRELDLERDKISADVATVREKISTAEREMSTARADIQRVAAQAALGDEAAATTLKAAEARRSDAAAEVERLQPALETLLARSGRCSAEFFNQRELVGSLTNGIDKEPDGPDGIFWRPAA